MPILAGSRALGYREPPLLANIASNIFSLAASATGRAANRAPSSMVTGSFASNAGHFGRPGPFGSPLLTKSAQYEDVVSAIERSTASHGRFALLRLLKTYGSSAEWKARYISFFGPGGTWSQ